jgi:hypothetical protein
MFGKKCGSRVEKVKDHCSRPNVIAAADHHHRSIHLNRHGTVSVNKLNPRNPCFRRTRILLSRCTRISIGPRWTDFFFRITAFAPDEGNSRCTPDERSRAPSYVFKYCWFMFPPYRKRLFDTIDHPYNRREKQKFAI